LLLFAVNSRHCQSFIHCKQIYQKLTINNQKKHCIALIGVLLFSLIFGIPNKVEAQGKKLFGEVEYLIGGIVPNFPNFPKTGISQGVNLSIGKTNHSDSHWANYFNKPSYGVTLSYLKSSNIQELGKEYGGSFFLDLSPNTEGPQKWFFRMGMGTTYFNKFYKSITNERNKVIGSHWNWRFNLFLFHQIKSFEKVELRLGAGYLHSSNGHTQIPNYGMNAAILSLSARFYQKNPYAKPDNFKQSESYSKKETTYFIQSRFGLGMHEYGGTTNPIGGPKKAVYASAFAFGWNFNQQLKLRTGFTYRFYQHYYEQMRNNDSVIYKFPKSKASNIYWLLGVEYLLGNFAIDIEGGINLYKPYFEEHFANHIKQSGIKKFLKSTIPLRMGLNYYLFKPSKQSNFNAFIGASINSNLSQADFSQINIGVSKRIKNKNQ